MTDETRTSVPSRDGAYEADSSPRSGEANPNPYLDPHHIGKEDDEYTLGFEPTSLDVSPSSPPASTRFGDTSMPSSRVGASLHNEQACSQCRPNAVLVERTERGIVSAVERERIARGLAEFLEEFPPHGVLRGLHRAEREEHKADGPCVPAGYERSAK